MLELFLTPEAWAALLALVTMEIVLGIDNLIFISIITNQLPEHQRPFARKIGIGLALGLRLVLLATIAWIVGLTEPVFDLGLSGEVDQFGHDELAGTARLVCGGHDNDVEGLPDLRDHRRRQALTEIGVDPDGVLRLCCTGQQGADRENEGDGLRFRMHLTSPS